jgi:uncharacterized protein GlcG (DUF336 family)
MSRSKMLVVLGMILGIAITTFWLNSPPSVARAEDQPVKGKPGAPGNPINAKDLSLDQAHAIVMAAMDKAKETQTKMDIAVVDAGGNLKAFVRMDGAWLGSIDISIKKAKTARFFDMPSGEIGKLSQPGGPLYQIEVSNSGLISFPGGVPIKMSDGTIIGAIGVSGSTVDNDHAVAAAGAAVIK